VGNFGLIFTGDVIQSQPTILANVLEEHIGENDFSTAFYGLTDLYLDLKEKRGLDTRDSAKDVFFSMIYGKANSKMAQEFYREYPEAGAWIKSLKKKPIPENPSKKIYSNLVWLLANKETEVFRRVWNRLYVMNIPFAPIHDEVLVQKEHEPILYLVMTEELSKHLTGGRVKTK
jgi:hypothetical protein